MDKLVSVGKSKEAAGRVVSIWIDLQENDKRGWKNKDKSTRTKLHCTPLKFSIFIYNPL